MRFVFGDWQPENESADDSALYTQWGEKGRGQPKGCQTYQGEQTRNWITSRRRPLSFQLRPWHVSRPSKHTRRHSTGDEWAAVRLLLLLLLPVWLPFFFSSSLFQPFFAAKGIFFRKETKKSASLYSLINWSKNWKFWNLNKKNHCYAAGGLNNIFSRCGWAKGCKRRLIGTFIPPTRAALCDGRPDAKRRAS